jgi:hypothetical protein
VITVVAKIFCKAYIYVTLLVRSAVGPKLNTNTSENILTDHAQHGDRHETARKNNM